ncbi:PIN domain-containing protein [uncultured Gilliamella sp.]|uniref:PIN domain-containing protein n=1 Tax=uncultured Gilliamella sp. TaxID=1193505 RepID=UPI0025F20D19|nr:PIN domain-containing protein [uncultured Gilliamella sp.]
MSDTKIINYNDLNLDDYCAISIDTNVFRKTGYNFQSSLIKRLPELGMICDILIHEIVYREMESHLTEELQKIDENVISTLNEIKKKKSHITNEQLDIVKNTLSIGHHENIIDVKLTKFLQETKCKIIDCYADFDIKRLIDDYFNNKYPFEIRNSKKNEFPDAIILHSLENYAKRNNKQKILIISEDLGWQKFAEKSDYLDCVDNLSVVYDAIYPFEIKQNIINCIKKIFFLQPNQQYDTLFNLLSCEVEKLNISVIANCSCAEVDLVDENYQIDLENIILSKDLKINVISIEQGKMSFTLPITLNIYITTMLAFYKYSDYSDYYEVGRQPYEYEELFTTDITLEISFSNSLRLNDLTMFDLKINRVELPFNTLDIDYGSVYLDIYEDY